MRDKEIFRLDVNGRETEVFAPSDATLLDVLRDNCALRAAKLGGRAGYRLHQARIGGGRQTRLKLDQAMRLQQPEVVVDLLAR